MCDIRVLARMFLMRFYLIADVVVVIDAFILIVKKHQCFCRKMFLSSLAHTVVHQQNTHIFRELADSNNLFRVNFGSYIKNVSPFQ